MNDHTQATEEKSDFRNRADSMANSAYGAVAGGILGETLSNPIEALAEDIKNRRLDRRNENNINVMKFQGRDARHTKEMRDRVARQRRKRYIPVPGLPNSATALAGMGLGATLGNPVVEKLKERSEARKLTRELEKEASAQYSVVPELQKPFFF